MSRRNTFEQYSARIEKVVAFLSDRLDQPLTLAQLADAGHFSPFHFHRVYRGLMGETIASTQRRLRLHRAATELIGNRQPIAQIAVRAGYGSVAAFTRAFGAVYGDAPAAFRKRRAALPALPGAAFDPTLETLMYTAQINTLAPIRVIALPHRGDYQTIGQSFHALYAWAGPRGLMRPDTRGIGIYYDSPADTPVEQLRSEACISASGEIEPGEGMRRVEIAGGRHAVVVHTGPYAELQRAYDWLFCQWLPASGEEAGDAPVYEEYLNDPSQLPPAEWKTAICLPLK
ncbi:AraC family transcriptional regulator [Lysobacter firmicutimachus]|uniref:AraC family transcriptional regulator n=1 Tax=Lysobacter firmicutimachus TaxID=1792846 RepID=A0ABU8D2G3_9GAMM